VHVVATFDKESIGSLENGLYEIELTIDFDGEYIDASQLNSEYALSKYVSEQNLRQKFQHGFCPTTILRFGIIYGSRKHNWSAVESLFHAVQS